MSYQVIEIPSRARIGFMPRRALSSENLERYFNQSRKVFYVLDYIQVDSSMQSFFAKNELMKNLMKIFKLRAILEQFKAKFRQRKMKNSCGKFNIHFVTRARIVFSARKFFSRKKSLSKKSLSKNRFYLEKKMYF